MHRRRYRLLQSRQDKSEVCEAVRRILTADGSYINTMNREKQSKSEKIIDTLALPKDLFLGVPVFTMYGNGELLIENHRGILIYGEDRMVIRARHFPICISGSNLCIDSYDEDSIRILGRIVQITFHL